MAIFPKIGVRQIAVSSETEPGINALCPNIPSSEIILGVSYAGISTTKKLNAKSGKIREAPARRVVTFSRSQNRALAMMGVRVMTHKSFFFLPEGE